MSLPASMPVVAGAAVATVPVPPTPITQSAIDLTIQSVRAEHANQAGVKASNAGGGTAQVFVSWRHRQLAAAGYVGWRRAAGLEVGAEVTYDLRPREEER